MEVISRNSISLAFEQVQQGGSNPITSKVPSIFAPRQVPISFTWEWKAERLLKSCRVTYYFAPY